jgi:hypothetical protein
MSIYLLVKIFFVFIFIVIIFDRFSIWLNKKNSEFYFFVDKNVILCELWNIYIKLYE